MADIFPFSAKPSSEKSPSVPRFLKGEALQMGA